MRKLLIIFALCFISASVSASDVSYLLGVTPGEVSKIKGETTGGPFEILRIPNPSISLIAVYPDLEIMISRANRKVIGVGANRAYESITKCNEAEYIVREALKTVFPIKYTGRDSRWQYQSIDKSITAGALCSNRKPYPVLRLDVTHTATNNEILKSFRRSQR